MRLTELQSQGDRYSASLDADEWGYPRTIDADEVEMSAWFRYGQDVIMWFIGRGEADGELVLHIVVRPSMRGKIYAREWMTFVRCIGMLLRYDRLRFIGEEKTKVSDLLERWGWVRDADGLFLDLEAGNVKITEDTEDTVSAPR